MGFLPPKSKYPIIIVPTLEYLVKEVLKKKKAHEKLWFRGQPNVDQTLIPSVCRPKVFGGRAVGRHDEQFLAHTFRLRAQSRYDNCPKIDDFPSWLFLMQHFGLPTRLLDWTASPLVASYFAVAERRSSLWYEDKKEWDPCEIYAIDPTILNSHELERTAKRTTQRKSHGEKYGPAERQFGPREDLIDPWDISFMPLFEEPFKGPSYIPNGITLKGPIYAIKPVELDMRVVIQASRFTIHCREEPLDKHPVVDRMLYRFIVPGDRRKEFQESLQKVKIHRATVFLDLDNLSKDLEFFGDSIDF